MNEFLPIVSGILAGSILCGLPRRIRGVVGAISTLSISALATWASGEFLVSWHFLYVDVLIVSGFQLAGFAAITGLLVLLRVRKPQSFEPRRGLIANQY